MFKYRLIIKLIFVMFLFSTTYAEIIIKYKINDEIITNFDIEYEANYLVFLRPELKKLSKEDLLKISENSLIREIIKNKELIKVYKNIENINFEKKIANKLIKFKNLDNSDQLKKIIKKNNLNYEDIINKMKNENLWNDLITRKYGSLVKIDKEKLKKELLLKLKNNKKFEYNLSELLFDIDKNDELEKKYDEIKKFISENNFKNAVSKYSLANSSKNGGDIGWIKETLLSKDLINILNKVEINGITKPIKYPNGYLILKLNNKKNMKQIIDIDKELQEVIKFETNKQLNQFSLLYYKKLKQNTIIYE